MLTNLYCLQQDMLLCAYYISPHVAHCKMLIALLTSMYEYAAHPRSSITASAEDTDLVTDVHWNHSSRCAQFRYSAQTCITPMQAQMSMLTKQHQLMVKEDADPSSPTTASSDSTHKPCDRCGLEQSAALTCAEQQCKHKWVTLVAGVADPDILLIQHHQLLMKYAAQPSSSIIASSGDTTDKPCD